MAATWDPLYGVPHLGSVRSVQASTEAAPAAADDGLDMAQVDAFNLYLKAAGGQTFTGVGLLLAYLYEAIRGTWVRCPGSDVGIPDGANGLAEFAISPLLIRSMRGRLALICSGVGVTGGSITIDFICTGPGGVLAQ